MFATRFSTFQQVVSICFDIYVLFALETLSEPTDLEMFVELSFCNLCQTALALCKGLRAIVLLMFLLRFAICSQAILAYVMSNSSVLIQCQNS